MRPAVSRLFLTILLLSGLLSVRSFAGCKVAIVSAISPTDPTGTATTGRITFSTVGTPAILQREGTMERASDVLIYDDSTAAGGNCFNAGNKIMVGYNGVMTYPASLGGSNFDIYDSAGPYALGISWRSYMANASTSVVEIDVLATGTTAIAADGITGVSAIGSAVRVKNLRFDATALAAGSNLTAVIWATTGLASNVTAAVGTAQDTITGAAVVQDGIGTQSSGDTLTTPGIFDYAENYSGAFRLASNLGSGVYGDGAVTATQIIYDLGTSLPWGVNVTFPSLIQVGGATGLTLTLRSGGTCSGPAQCTAVYGTSANGAGVYDLKTTTAKVPNTGEDGELPAIGVFINNPSGYGTATLKMSVVPSHLASLPDLPVQVLSIPLMGNGQTVTSSAPTISGIAPTSAVAGAGATTLTVTGSGFTSSSVVQWNGSARPTTYVSATQLAAAISATDLASAGVASITVTNGTTASNAATFSITSSPRTTSPFQYVLPHIMSGNGYATKVTIVNTSAQQNSVVLNFVSQAGTTLSSNTYSMAPGATLRVDMTDAERFGTAVTKWATVGSQAPVLTNCWYDYKANATDPGIGNSVGFNDAAPLIDFSLPAEFLPGVAGVTYGKTVGLALANPNPIAATATVKLVDSTGAVLATKTVSLPAYGQMAVDLQQDSSFASSLPSGDFVGSITVSATQPLSSIAVQDNDGLFSAVPVGLGRAK